MEPLSVTSSDVELPAGLPHYRVVAAAARAALTPPDSHLLGTAATRRTPADDLGSPCSETTWRLSEVSAMARRLSDALDSQAGTVTSERRADGSGACAVHTPARPTTAPRRPIGEAAAADTPTSVGLWSPQSAGSWLKGGGAGTHAAGAVLSHAGSPARAEVAAAGSSAPTTSGAARPHAAASPVWVPVKAFSPPVAYTASAPTLPRPRQLELPPSAAYGVRRRADRSIETSPARVRPSSFRSRRREAEASRMETARSPPDRPTAASARRQVQR